MIQSAIKKIIRLNKDEIKTPIEVMVKLQEECGELAAEMLRSIGRKGSNGDSKKITKLKVLEEACDVIITATSIIEKFGFNDCDMARMIKKKCNKWKLNQKKYKQWETQI